MDGDDTQMTGSMAEMVISDNNAYLMAMGAGSRIEIHAADASKESWTELSQTADAGSNQLVLTEDTGWEVGDQIAIASTSDDWTESEEFTVTAVSADGMTVTLDRPLQHTHRGETVTYDNGQTGSDFVEWDVEVRAEVALLSRNVTIQGDEDSVEDGFGGHTMIMEGAEQHISGAEFFRMGQEDILGRYPIHWHMLGEATGQYVEDVSVHHSYQKGATIHGTSNIRFEDNVIFDHVGHGVFFEDGSENGNQILGNLVFNTRESQTGEPIPTDAEHASSFWIENPNNIFIGNHAAGSQSNGFWIIPATEPHGLSAETFVGDAGSMSDLIFIDNTGHSSGEAGDNGAGGEGKILGIDGRLTADLDFRQSTLSGEFAVIDGFTGYEGNIWALTHEMVFQDTALLDGRFFARHENLIDNAIFDDTTIVLYRDGGNQYNDVHVVGNSQLLHLATDHLNTANAFNNVTIDDGGRSSFGGGLNDGFVNQQVTVDIDGALTGIPGAFITPSGDGAAFKAGPDATTVAGVAGFVSTNTIAATEVTALGIDGPLRLLRSDGESIEDMPTSKDRRVQGDDAEDRSAANYEFFTSTGLERDLAYLIDFEEMPAELTLNLTGAREGESVVYEIPSIAGSYQVTDGGTRVFSFDELLDADTSVYYRDNDSGSVFVRLVASASVIDPDRPVIDLLGDYRTNTSLTMTITGDDSSNVPHGAREISQTLIDAIMAQPERSVEGPPAIADAQVTPENADFVLERFASTSDTTEETDAMPRWSEAATWDVGVPLEDDIVVIGMGQTVVLDQSATVKGIIVNGGELIIEDDPDLTLELASDYVLVINGGLFQAGTETDPLDTDFTLTLEGDDPDFDLEVSQILNGEVDNTVMAMAVIDRPDPVPTPTPTPGDDGEILGTDGADMLMGTDDADIIKALLGDDDVYAKRGADEVYGGRDDDMLAGNKGRDMLIGAGGQDHLKGGSAKDILMGGARNDILDGGRHADILTGGKGNDTFL
ncbi:MAG: G8 domain-containing protein, partial [Pseudomonadota bacterium]